MRIQKLLMILLILSAESQGRATSESFQCQDFSGKVQLTLRPSSSDQYWLELSRNSGQTRHLCTTYRGTVDDEVLRAFYCHDEGNHPISIGIKFPTLDGLLDLPEHPQLALRCEKDDH